MASANTMASMEFDDINGANFTIRFKEALYTDRGTCKP
jgi:hypothetical protein